MVLQVWSGTTADQRGPVVLDGTNRHWCSAPSEMGMVTTLYRAPDRLELLYAVPASQSPRRVPFRATLSLVRR
jgi:hypothetical protein